MTDRNLAAVLYGKKNLRVEERPILEPGPGEVQIRMSSVGICGTDVHCWLDGGIEGGTTVSGLVTGHEGAGIVNKLGEGVTHLDIGDRVAIEPIRSCRRCDLCKAGRYNLCSKRKICSVPPTHGNMSRYYVHDADLCYKLPDHVTTEEGALLEPLSVAVHACRLSKVSVGSSVLICGAGTIGLVSLMVAKASGASKVCITDLDERRLDVAKDLGADCILKVTSNDPVKIAREVEAIMGKQPDVTIECAGADISTQTAVYATKSGGCVALVGIGSTDLTPTPLVDAILREICIQGIVGQINCYPTALSLVASGKIDVKPLITHRFNMEEVVKAFETSMEGSGIKVMINCSEQ